MKKSEVLALAKKMRESGERKARFSVGDDRGPANELAIHKGTARGNDVMSIAIRKFQEDADLLLLTSKATRIPVEKLKSYGRFKTFIEESELKKAMTTTTQANWIPTDFSRDFIDQVQLLCNIENQFPEVVIPRSPFEISQKGSFSTAYKKTEGSSATISPALTDTKLTFSAKTICAYQELSYELDEDAAFAQAPMIRNDCINAIARAKEDCIINGDTTATHMDSDVTLAYDARKCWKGLRRFCIDNTYMTDLSTWNSVTLLGLKSSMAIFGASPSMLFWLVGTGGHVKLLSLKDDSNNKVFLEAGSPGAPVASMIPGQVGTLAGSNVLTTEFVRENLNASGVYDGTNTTKKNVMLVRKDGFVRGTVRQILVETDKNIVSQINQLVVSTRMDFQPRYAIASNKTVWMGYNIA